MNIKVIKTIVFIANVVGAAASVAAGWASLKAQDAEIGVKIAEAIAKNK